VAGSNQRTNGRSRISSWTISASHRWSGLVEIASGAPPTSISSRPLVVSITKRSPAAPAPARVKLRRRSSVEYGSPASGRSGCRPDREPSTVHAPSAKVIVHCSVVVYPVLTETSVSLAPELSSTTSKDAGCSTGAPRIASSQAAGGVSPAQSSRYGTRSSEG
jgi:hypothetical protein